MTSTSLKLSCAISTLTMFPNISLLKKQGGWNYSRLFIKVPLNNFDIMTDRYRGLKELEGFMGSNIKETSVPFDIDRKLTDAEIQEVIRYCRHDVEQTMEVFLNRVEEFESQMGLIKAFSLPLSHVNKNESPTIRNHIGS